MYKPTTEILLMFQVQATQSIVLQPLCLALDQEPEMIAELSNLAGGLVCEM